jgi:CRISPR-associated protein Csx14
MFKEQTSVMIALLGGQPQIVTFALDALLAQGENVREVIVLYLSSEESRVNRALARLSPEFADDHYLGRLCRLRPMPIRDGLARLPDIQNETHAEATREMLRDLIVSLKAERHGLHVCVSGGRRIMALLMMSVALFHFGYRDKLWHVYTPDELQARAEDGAIMHARPEDGVRLIQVPLVPLSNHFPALQELARLSSLDTVKYHLRQLDRQERARCQQVVSDLTPRELETLQAFAAGLSPQETADQMGISLNTVNTYKKKILELCRNAWPEREGLRYYHLREWFGPYFEV